MIWNYSLTYLIIINIDHNKYWAIIIERMKFINEKLWFSV